MPNPSLILCPECVQHIHRVEGSDEQKCPFCDAQFSISKMAGRAPRASAIPTRVKRGVMAASFVGATVLGAAACSETSQPEYGMPIPDEDVGYSNQADAGDDKHADVGYSNYDNQTAQPEYGAPMPYEDTGYDNQSIQPEYGAPMPYEDVGVSDEDVADDSDSGEGDGD